MVVFGCDNILAIGTFSVEGYTGGLLFRPYAAHSGMLINTLTRVFEVTNPGVLGK